jgi:hypothetical protein
MCCKGRKITVGKVSVRQVEGVPEMLDFRHLVIAEENSDDVEAGTCFVEPVLGQPGESCLGNLALLEGGYGKLRRSECQSPAGLDLDKDERLAIPGDDVHLACLAAEVPCNDSELLPPQIGDGDCLAPLANGFVV